MEDNLKDKNDFSKEDVKFKIRILVFSIIIGILFYNFTFRYIGVSAVIFVCILISGFLIINGMKNKNLLGIFFMIVSFILSLNYSIYTNQIFRVLNMFLIPILLISSFLLITYENINFKFIEFFNLVLERIFEKGAWNLGIFIRFLKYLIRKNKKSKNINNIKLIGIGILVSVPILIILLIMLSNADKIFEYYINNIMENMNFKFSFMTILKLIITIWISVVVFCIYNSFSIDIENKKTIKKISIEFNPIIITTILSFISILYVAFTKIQITYLYFNKELPKGFIYSEYARSGFFQLVALVVINMILVVIINKFTKYKNHLGDNILKGIYLLITTLTFNMAFSALYKMRLYIKAFGFTRLRFLVSIFTIFLGVVIILFLIFILKNINVFKPIAILGLIMYIGINFFNIDNFITTYNLKLANNSSKVDMYYLTTLSFDNYKGIIKGYKDGKISKDIYDLWIERNTTDINCWYEYNYFNSKGNSIQN